MSECEVLIREETACNGPFRARIFEKLATADVTAHAANYFAWPLWERLHKFYEGWRLEKRVERDPDNINVKHVKLVIVFANNADAETFRRSR